ncbi:Surface antigen [Robiginitalea myxolifaciens]|uniref:Surface antigen n=1 Tax=Robiginitalea myxolifaciens TaxID=400055 RepID=A0A1I6H1N9_9FLAO|nr:BamA/TamA family outer membrane protein [Robiginitalea myxolifaciens]SFR48330.1 Surface antigen [Robiginitalea myxolifaciens]
MKLSHLWILLFFCSSFTLPAFGQEGESNSTSSQDSIANLELDVLPVVVYSPETGVIFGGIGVGTFRFNSESKDSFPSAVQLAAGYTTKNQILFWAPYELYWDDAKWRLFGELGYYKYVYNFYGIGIDSREQDLETYEVSFPRVRINGLRELFPGFLAGIGFEFDAFYNLEAAENGTLANAEVLGKEGGIISNLGVLAVYDSRDNIFQPTRGFFIQAGAFRSLELLGSEFTFSKFNVDARYYQRLKGQHILAGNIFIANSGEGTPFLSMNNLGTNRSRGFDNRRFLDNGELNFALEYRFPIFRRFGGVVFGSSGTVAPTFSDLFNSKFRNAGGVGLRYVLNQKDGIRVRLDYGWTREGGNLYFTVREAF